MNEKHTIRLGKKRVPPVPVPGEIFEVYQPHIGPNATLLWLNLRWLVHAEASGNIEEILQARTGFTFRALTEGLSSLLDRGLLEIAETGEYVLNEPLSAEGYSLTYGQKAPVVPAHTASNPEVVKAPPAPEVLVVEIEAEDTPVEPSNTEASVTQLAASAPASTAIATANEAQTEAAAPIPESNPEPPASPLSRRNRRRVPVEPVSAVAPEPQSEAKPETRPRRSEGGSRNADMDAVVQIYHNKIGMLGPTQFDKLKFWVEEQGMAGEVVALAIEETVQSAQNPRIQYLEGILRNWFNDGILTLQDLLKHKKASKVLSGGDDPAAASMEGVPNASAYKRVDPEMVKKWKELYPDEYDG